MSSMLPRFLRKKGVHASGSDEDEGASLLANDSLGPSMPTDVLSDSLDASAAVSSEVGSLKTSGRRARAAGDGLESTRSADALSALGGIGMEGALMGLDMVVPGIGAGVGGAMAAKGVRDDVRSGGSSAGAVAAHGGRVASSFIPVVGEFIGMLESGADLLRAICQPAKARTQAKQAEVDRIRTDGASSLRRIDSARAEVMALDDSKDKRTLLRRLAKAEARWHAALAQVNEWQEKKMEHQTLPLLAGASSSVSDDDEG